MYTLHRKSKLSLSRNFRLNCVKVWKRKPILLFSGNSANMYCTARKGAFRSHGNVIAQVAGFHKKSENCGNGFLCHSKIIFGFVLQGRGISMEPVFHSRYTNKPNLFCMENVLHQMTKEWACQTIIYLIFMTWVSLWYIS